ncbi:hypothetical protein I3I95_01935 [bacterium]|nr:hypothetical protein [bacterium]
MPVNKQLLEMLEYTHGLMQEYATLAKRVINLEAEPFLEQRHRQQVAFFNALTDVPSFSARPIPGASAEEQHAASQPRELRERERRAEIARLTARMQDIYRTYCSTVGKPDDPLYPPDYCTLPACEHFIRSVRNQMATTVGEAVRIYEESLYRDQVLGNQQRQVAELAHMQAELKGLRDDARTLHEDVTSGTYASQLANEETKRALSVLRDNLEMGNINTGTLLNHTVMRDMVASTYR